MKLLVLLILIVIIAAVVYFYSSSLINKKQKKKQGNWKAISLTAATSIILFGFVLYLMYQAAVAPDTQCIALHQITSSPPKALNSASDYFLQGNYDYDRGDCKKAIDDYTISIQLNPNYPQSYNNRAYTYMRMQNYKDALRDLDKALSLNPNYVEALMNRGDIHNYYYQIDRPRAVVDYEKVIALGGSSKTSVCGHLLLAKHNGWNIGTIIDLPISLLQCQR